MITATLIGTKNRGALGDVPVVSVPTAKPKFRNNGYNVYSGQPSLRVPGLRAALLAYDAAHNPNDPRPQGHVLLKYSDGGHFGTFTYDNGNDVFNFS